MLEAPPLPNVDGIIAAIRQDGDSALARYAARFGDDAPRRITPEEIDAAVARTPENVLAALRAAAERIGAFARAQRAALLDVELDVGWATIGHRVVPFERAGIYVPAGRFPLPSTLLMCAIPARVAGVERAFVCTPKANDVILAAAHIAEVHEIVLAGGAQAIAAMAYGTQTVPRADIVVGPGNAYVAAAKRAIFGDCAIDTIAGPSELLVIASGDADARLVAADLRAQAEHDDRARPMLLTDDARFASEVTAELSHQGGMRQTQWLQIVTLAEAVEVANRLAPEHLALHGSRAERLASQLRSYGTLFIGEHAAEVFGDYGSGPNHVLPTGGSARFSSGLSVYAFLAIRTFERAKCAPDPLLIEQTATLAGAEGLDAHRDAALARLR